MKYDLQEVIPSLVIAAAVLAVILFLNGADPATIDAIEGAIFDYGIYVLAAVAALLMALSYR